MASVDPPTAYGLTTVMARVGKLSSATAGAIVKGLLANSAADKTRLLSREKWFTTGLL
jgi:hypothetical protein